MSGLRHAVGVAAVLLLQPLAATAFTPALADLDRVPLTMQRAPLAKHIEVAAGKTRPLQFAVKAPLTSGLGDGLWDLVDASTARWRLRVASPGAQSLSLEFDRFRLPVGAQLWVYDRDGGLVQGPYTRADETPEGKLWTALVLDEQAVLELRVSVAGRDDVELELAQVAHGFRGFGKDEPVSAKSGACNIDVVCPQGNAWRNEIRSVARVSIDGTFLCTGQMLNNTRQNNDPLFITANHCGIGQNRCGITGTGVCSPSSAVLYWNFHNSTCRSSTGTGDRNGNGSLSQSQAGASLLAGDVGTDFSLLRLNRLPLAAHNVYYAGWNATNNVPQSGASIHHPEGDEKSIALFNAPARRTDSCIEGTLTSCNRNVHAWGVHWNEGTTEQGSSGGGLWDQNHFVVGWLSGGEASCTNRGGEDYYGRMEAAWQAGPLASQQLQPWLSPDDAGVKSICGKNQSGGSCDSAGTPGDGDGGDGGGGGALGWMTLLPLWLLARRRIWVGALLALAIPTASAAEGRAFTVQDLVMMARVGDPRVSPDARQVAYTLRETDFAANKGVKSIWLASVSSIGQPRRLTAGKGNSDSPRWAPDSRTLYFLSSRSGSTQVWRLSLDGGEAQAVTDYPLDVEGFVLSPDGKRLALAFQVFTDCHDLACTRKRLDERTESKRSGQLFDRLFVRHWDTWADGRRNQLFAVGIGADGKAAGEPTLVSRGIDGDVPSKPFGDDSEFCFSRGGRELIFAARIAGKTEPWSTNFDLYVAAIDGAAKPRNLTPANEATDTGPVVSPDGRQLAWRAMKRPKFESDRLGIWVMDLKTGTQREVAASWDRSADGLAFSADGTTLYTMAEEVGQKKLFAIDVASGKVTALSGQGSVSAFSAVGNTIVYALDTLASPAQLFLHGARPQPLTAHNAERLAQIAFTDFEQFQFAGWNNEPVHGYVHKPYGYRKGKKYPLALLIHGGPQGSYGNDFHYRWNPQVWAGMGYGVVTIDFHGSTGYGQAFTDSISQDWGGKPLEDLQKGLAHVLKSYDFLDGARACALGASYGGYMVNWIEGRWGDAFKCLVNHDGNFDQRFSYYSTEELWFEEWEHGGAQYEVPENYEKFNPANHVDQWKTPMLVIHGEKDFRLPYVHGIAAFTALQRRGVPSQLLIFPDENHWVLKPQNSVQWHETIQAWLKRWIGG